MTYPELPRMRSVSRPRFRLPGARFRPVFSDRSSSSSDGVDAPRRHRRAKVVVFEDHLREASVEEVSTIGLDLAKHVFQAHGARVSGAVVFRKKLRREQVLTFFAGQPRCLVAMEACASSHHWARAIGELGHEVRLIPLSSDVRNWTLCDV